ncbi:retrovirus-related pol polyprotein from transposon TNT 1-94 [Tanacetum coccineum]
MSYEKEAQIKFYKTREDKELDKVIPLENKVKVLDDIVYKTGQSVQTINMLHRNCKTSFAKPEFLKKAQRVNPHLYDIGCYNDNLALMLAPESDKMIRLAKESRSKLSDLIRPFDYDQLNNLYDLFIPQREKSHEQHYFSKASKMSQTSANNEISKESFRVIPTSSFSRPQLKSNRMGDRFMPNNSQGKMQEVEDHGITHETSTARIPKQNGAAERRNHTLVEAARTMLSAAKVPLDGENLDKMKEKGDACIFVSSDLVPQCSTTVLKQDSLSPDLQSQENVPQAPKIVTTSYELDLLFILMFDELLNESTPVVSKSPDVHAADAPDKRQHHNTTHTSTTTVVADAPPLNIQTTP